MLLKRTRHRQLCMAVLEMLANLACRPTQDLKLQAAALALHLG